MKYRWRRLLALVMSLALVLNLGILNASAEETAGDVSLLQDGSFEADIWDGSPWSFGPESWDGTTIEWKSDTVCDGGYSVNYYSESANAITVSQSVTLEAGTYKLTACDQGADSTFQLFLGDQTGDAVALTGWGIWDNAEQTFTIEADDTYTVGVYLNCAAGGWGYLDNMSLVKINDDSGEDSDEGKDEGYAVIVTPDTSNVQAGDTVTLNISVTNNGEAITDLSEAGLNLTTWLDHYADNGHDDGNNDAVIASPNALSTEVTLPSEGTYYLVTELYDSEWNTLASYTTTFTAASAAIEGHAVIVTPDTVEAEPGDTVTLTAVVIYDGEEITDLEASGLSLWWWIDSWNDHADGLDDAEYSNYDENSGHSLTADVTLPSKGTYYIAASLEDSNGEKQAETFVTCIVESSTTVEAEINVEKVPNLSDDFIMGMDISSVMSEFASGVTYQDFEGRTIDNITDFCLFLADCGVTSIRVRIWNDPYDENHNSYGGGNNDINTAVEIAKGCAAAGLDMLLDFHCSDFWTDPSKQQAPKAWAGYSVAQKAEALKQFLTESLAAVDDTGANIAMVQVGNETTGGFIGETNVGNMCTLFNAGAEAVHDYDENIKVVIHITNPEKSTMTTWAKNLDTYGVDYDVLATSYYPSWHGTFANLKSQLQAVQNTYGKEVMVAETSYAFTLEDTDGHENTIHAGQDDTMMCEEQYPFTVQGQASYLRDLINVVNEAGGLGVFYWESAWITVGDTTGLTGGEYKNQVETNKITWEEYGSGWASSYAGQYNPDDAGLWYGGSAVDNQAMFAADGSPLASINVWKLVGTGAESIYTTVESIDPAEESITAGGEYTLPETIAVTYNKGTVQESVTWDEEDIAAIDVNVSGTYVVNGTVTFSREVDSGSYAGQTTAPAIYTLTVKAPNLIGEDWSFENGSANFSGLDSTGKGIDGETPYDGSNCLHWYLTSAGTAEVTYNAGITLEPGTYTFECMAQGYAGDTVALNILNHDTNDVLAKGNAVAATGYAAWMTPAVSFTVTETVTVDLQIVIGIQAGGWGTIDCMYLYGETDSSSDVTDLTDDETDITVSGDNLGGLKLVVNGIDEDSEEYIAVSNAIGNSYSNVVLYDIHLEDILNGETAELNAAVTVKIPVPEGWDASKVKVFHVADNNETTDMNADVDETGSYILFTTDHFSYYVLALENDESDSDDGQPGGDQSGSGQPGGDQSGSGQPGGDQSGSGQPGGDQSGSGQPGGDQSGSGQPGGNQSNDNQSDDDSSDDETSGTDSSNTTNVNSDKSPATGDYTPGLSMVILYALVMLGCMILTVQYHKRRN